MESPIREYNRLVALPATVAAIADAVLWANRIMQEMDRRRPAK
jgi:hypothetical protein